VSIFVFLFRGKLNICRFYLAYIYASKNRWKDFKANSYKLSHIPKTATSAKKRRAQVPPLLMLMAGHTGQSSQLFAVPTGRNAQFVATIQIGLNVAIQAGVHGGCQHEPGGNVSDIEARLIVT
jgi:hypothetical protein